MEIEDIDEKTLERFWNKVNKSSGCWEWLGAKDRDGYGYFGVKRKAKKAHRLSWLLFFKTDPGKYHVCHKCDNPSCVNPDHLFLGSHTDNVQDCVRKGRNNIGTRNGSSKLTPDDIQEIRRKYKFRTYGTTKLAEEYGVSYQMIHRIVTDKNWRHV